jgi:Family of unknown function (DUF6998)
MRISLPEPVAKIYEAVEAPSAAYPGRPFTPDGHLVGSIGEVIAAEALALKLVPPSTEGFDAIDSEGREVQIKLTSTRGVSLNADCDRLVIMRIADRFYADLVYDGDGASVWERAGKMQKNGQRRISFARMRDLPGWVGVEP